MNTTEIASASRRWRSSAWATRSWKSARLARPVSLSWNAWCRSSLLEALAFADVSDVEHHAAHIGVLLEIGPHGLGEDVATARGAKPELERTGAVTAAGSDDERGDEIFVFGVSQRDELATLELGRRVAEHRRGGTRVRDRAVLPDHHDQVGRVLHQRFEARFALTGCQVLVEGRPLQRQRDLRRQRFEPGERRLGECRFGGDRDRDT